MASDNKVILAGRNKKASTLQSIARNAGFKLSISPLR